MTRRVPSRARITATFTCALIATAFVACVSEPVYRKPRGLPVQRVAGGTPAEPLAPPPSSSLTLPDSPIARPAETASVTDSRVTVAVKPLGVVPFDGLVLPLVSPDGRFLATQVGEAPAWETIRARPGASVPRCRVDVYDLSVTPPRRVEPAGAVEPGLMLGRDADARGVLVESARPDGSRWIGLLPWTGGPVQWLVTGRHVNAHAVLTRDGTVAFTRRDADSADAVLVIRSTAGEERTLATPGVSYVFPAITPDASAVCVFAAGAPGLELQGIALDAAGHGELPPPRARRLVTRSTDWLPAYQCVSPFQPCQTGPGADRAGASLMIFHPIMGRVALFDSLSAEVSPLAERSVSGTPYRDGTGTAYFLTTTRGLVHQRVRGAGPRAVVLPEARTLSESWVPRATRNEQSPFVLIGPGPREQPGTLSVMAMQVVPATDADRSAPTTPRRASGPTPGPR